MKYDQITESKTREDKLEVVKLPYKLGDLSPVLSKKNVDYLLEEFLKLELFNIVQSI